MFFALQTANVTADAKNCFYPNRAEIRSGEDLKAAVRFDHVCGEFKNNYRSIINFLKSNVIVMDCDNDHSDDPADWITFEKLDEYHLAKSYPVSIYGSRVITNSPVYNGKDQQPEIKVMMGGVELTPDNYDVIQAREDGIDIREGAEASGIEGMTFVDAGDYSLEIVPKENSEKYSNSIPFVYTIKKATQKIKSVKPAKKTVRRGKTFKLKTTLSKGNGKVTYKKTKGDKKIKVTKAGTVKVGKKLKKGKTYRIKVKVSVASTNNYKATSTTKTITIKVK